MGVLLAQLVNLVVQVITVAIVANSILSFVVDPWHPARRFLDRFTEPILRPFRNVIPPVGMYDLSPLIALIIIQVLGNLLVGIFVSLF